jgi:plasmid stabilization system protein ParE
MMIHHVIITRRAEREMHDAAHWWASNRSAERANRWLTGLRRKLESLAKSPTRCPLAQENAQFPYELRELRYGVGSRPTHRAVFTIADNLVLVVAVRHLAQDQIRPEDVT